MGTIIFSYCVLTPFQMPSLVDENLVILKMCAALQEIRHLFLKEMFNIIRLVPSGASNPSRKFCLLGEVYMLKCS